MKWLWAWNGESFGYRDGDSLFTHDGKHIGKFYGSEIYDIQGKYLGEIKNDRLISDTRKKTFLKHPFFPHVGNTHSQHANYTGYIMRTGYQNFPSLHAFK